MFEALKESSSPYINRFLSADSIVPDVFSPQSLNRYSYVMNNPVRYIDPTGHKCVEMGPSECLNEKGRPINGAGGLTPAKKPGRDGNNSNTDTDGNGIPDLPDPNWVIPPSGGLCQYADLTECLYSGGAWPSGDFTISNKEWNQLTLALYYDIYRRSHEGNGFWTLEYDPTGRSQQENVLFVPFHTAEYYHREIYDTPFWDHYGDYEGNICFETAGCYDRNDVNYVAQGMWSGAAHEGSIGALVVANVWKLTQYEPPHLASADVNYWAARGEAIYEYYINLGR